MPRHISIEENKVHPPNTYRHNLERSPPKLFPPPPQPLGVLRDEVKEKINELEEKSKLVLILLDKGLMPTR
jgi:hypothetical protein